MDVATAVEAMRNGANVSIMKDRLKRLPAAIRRGLAATIRRERKQARSRLRESEKLLRAIVDNSTAVITLKDTEGKYLLINKRYETLFHVSSEEITGKSDYDIFPKDIAAAFRANDLKVLAAKVPLEFEENALHDDGIHTYISLKFPLINTEGEAYSVCGISSDITEQKTLQEQLRQSQKMEALETLVGGIAHDFNNMLAGMTGNLYLARNKCQDRPEVVEKLKNVEKLSFRAAGMIDQLLAFARKGIVQMQPFSLTMFMKEAFKLARVSIPENIVLHRHLCSTDLIVNGDAMQLQQVLLNLLSNACDAVQGLEKPVITLKLSEWEADAIFLSVHPGVRMRRFARLTVEDNGSGIHEDHLDNIFEPFFTTKEVGKGTGLGLAMVSGALQSHGGVVQVDSELGRGTRFHVYLPLLDSKPASDYTIQDKTYAGHGETILLADDEAIVRQTSKDILESLGYRVLEAGNGSEAIDVFSANRDEIALLILDVIMPKLGGVEAAGRIRELKPCVPVIFATGYHKQEVAVESRKLQHSRVLTKPFPINAFSKCIRDLLDVPEQ